MDDETSIDYSENLFLQIQDPDLVESLNQAQHNEHNSPHIQASNTDSPLQ